MFKRNDLLASFDPELARAIAGEVRRQESHVELIASENYCSPRVMGYAVAEHDAFESGVCGRHTRERGLISGGATRAIAPRLRPRRRPNARRLMH